MNTSASRYWTPVLMMIHICQKRLLVTQKRFMFLERLTDVRLVCDGVSESFRTQSITKYKLTFGITRCCPLQRVMAAKLTRLTHKIAVQLHQVAETCTICSSRSRWWVQKLLDTPSYEEGPICVLTLNSDKGNEFYGVNMDKVYRPFSSAEGILTNITYRDIIYLWLMPHLVANQMLCFGKREERHCNFVTR
jgi:hypothetical protein